MHELIVGEKPATALTTSPSPLTTFEAPAPVDLGPRSDDFGGEMGGGGY